MAQTVDQKLLFRWTRSDEGNERSIVEAAKDAINTALNIVTTPFKLAVSKTAWKVYLTTFFFFFASIALLTVSSVAYSIFYYNYIPQISLDRVVHLQYGDDTYPYGTVDLPERVLTTNQAYDVIVSLRLPPTPNNVAAGNFMLDLKLLASSTVPLPSPTAASGSTQNILRSIYSPTDSNAILSHSRRPAILPQPTHSLLSHLDTLFLRLPWSILTFPFHWGTRSMSNSILTVESDNLDIGMFESVIFGPSSGLAGAVADVPSQAHLEIQTLKHVTVPLQVYSASIHFHARFTGLKYVVYNYRIFSFLLFTTIFYILSLCAMATAYVLLSLVYLLRQPEGSGSSPSLISKPPPGIKVKAEPSDHPVSKTVNSRLIKSEPPEENTSALEDIPHLDHTEAQSRRQTQGQEQISTGGIATPTSSRIRDGEGHSDSDYDIFQGRGEYTGDEVRDFDSGLGTSVTGMTNTAPPNRGATFSSNVASTVGITTGFSRSNLSDHGREPSNSGARNRSSAGSAAAGGDVGDAGDRIDEWLEDSHTPPAAAPPTGGPSSPSNSTPVQNRSLTRGASGRGRARNDRDNDDHHNANDEDEGEDDLNTRF